MNRLMKTAFRIALFLGMSSVCIAQPVLLGHTVARDTVTPETGPNRKHHAHLFFGEGLIIGPSDAGGADIIQGNSNNLDFGVRYKRKIGGVYSVGFEVYLSRRNFRLKQDSGKVFPTTNLYDKEKLQYNTLKVGVFQRFNFDRDRGNFIGKYLDLGGYGEVLASGRHVTMNKPDIASIAGASKIRNTNTNLVYANLLNYGVRARFGSNKVSVYGDYRLSDMFDTDVANLYTELPRIMVGLEVDLF
jgi:hypothetical protein